MTLLQKTSRRLFLLLTLLLAACSLPEPPEPIVYISTVVHTVEVTREMEVTREVQVQVPVTITPSFTSELSPTPTLTSTITLTPTITPTYTITPTFANPKGEVIEQANCRYGPGAAYLYKYGLYEGYRVEVLGRNQLGSWAWVQALGFPDPCWVKVSLLELDGDIFSVGEYYSRLPYSDLYRPPTFVQAERDGDEVAITWAAVWMTEDDYRGYLIESWLCQDGQLVFTPIHIDGTTVTVIDEAGCHEASGGRLYTAEKHGYTQWVLIPWPPHEANE